jgi:hypothetical protein
MAFAKGDFVRFTDEAIKKYTSKKFQKGHANFCKDFYKVLPINQFKIMEIRDSLAVSDKIFIGGLFSWYISSEDLELIPEVEVKDPNFFYISGDVNAYLAHIEDFKRGLWKN